MKNVIFSVLFIILALIIISGILGYHIMIQHQSIEFLKHDLETAREDITQKDILIEAVRQELSGFIDETSQRIDGLDVKINTNYVELDTESKRITSVTNELFNLNNQVSDIVPGLDADSVYNNVAKSVVQISDGEHIVGAGFVYDTKGHIVTAFHVVEEISEAHIIFFDGSFARADVVSSSKYSDVALLKLQTETTTKPVNIKNSGDLKVGDDVLVVGHPFGVLNSLSVGVISNLDEFTEIEGSKDFKWVANLIQFDAASNPGNSGGPMFDSQGNLVGMVIARLKPTSGSGISYAVSSGKIQRCIDDMIRDGRYYYPYLGIYAADLTPLDCYDHAFTTVQGAYVQYVNGGARNAGLMQGDLVISVNGFTIHDVAELASITCEHVRYKGSAQIRLIRAGEQLDFEILTGYRAESISEVTGIPTTNSYSDAPELPSI